MRTYQKKYLPDGSLNLAWKPDTRKRTGNRHQKGYIQPSRKKFLPDGSLNPTYQPYRAPSRHYLLPDGTVNPAYHSRGNQHKPKKDFIAIDGEGITGDNGEHRYVLLVASTGEHLIRPEGLSSQECFDFLCDLGATYPHAIFVCFGASYDMNQMLRDIPKDRLEDLWAARDRDPEHQAVQWKGENRRDYSLSYRPRKSFIVRRFGKPKFWPYLQANWKDETGQRRTKTKKCQNAQSTAEEQEQFEAEITASEHPQNGRVSIATKYRPHFDGRCVLWDVFGFFQTSFVEALGGKQGYLADLLQERTDEAGKKQRVLVFASGLEVNLTRMEQMKKQRSTFSQEQVATEILPYCREEVAALVHLMNRLRSLLGAAGLKLARWDGAGAAAGALLQREKIKAHMQEDRPKGLLEAQRTAYAGGRIESGQFGSYLGPVYNYDLNSAYPSAAMRLPSLTGGHWRKVTGPSAQAYSLSYIRWQFDSSLPYYPFFYRDSDGSIYFPPQGEGWYWQPEVEAAQRAWQSGKLSTKEQRGTIEIVESWEFLPASDEKPFAFIEGLYSQRAIWKQANNPAEKALKLAINSIYGKTAQSLGGSETQHPTYHNIGWAGYITSVTRARLFTAIMQAPEKIVQIQTDGIYSLAPLDLPPGRNLGEWECTQIDGIIAVQPGIYWGLTKLGREPTEEEQAQADFRERFLFWRKQWFKVNPHYRGLNKGSFTAEGCLQAWEGWRKNTKKNMPSPFTVPATRFIGLGSALASSELWPFWRTFRTIERQIDLLPTGKGKRYYPFPGRPEPDKQLCQTHATALYWSSRKKSATYRPKWGERQEMEKYLDGVPQEQVEMELWESTL